MRARSSCEYEILSGNEPALVGWRLAKFPSVPYVRIITDMRSLAADPGDQFSSTKSDATEGPRCHWNNARLDAVAEPHTSSETVVTAAAHSNWPAYSTLAST